MTFKEAVARCAELARKEGKLYYLYQAKTPGEYRASPQHWSDWLFKAYPGGRAVLSMRGNKIAEAEKGK